MVLKAILLSKRATWINIVGTIDKLPTPAKSDLGSCSQKMQLKLIRQDEIWIANIHHMLRLKILESVSASVTLQKLHRIVLSKNRSLKPVKTAWSSSASHGAENNEATTQSTVTINSPALHCTTAKDPYLLKIYQVNFEICKYAKDIFQ